MQAILQILSFLNLPRLREVWAHPHSFARFDIVEARFTDGQYPNHRLAITLYCVASKFENKTIAKLIWGSQK